ncbi:MAG: T9SS type A sorting domain-containing protein [Bacteroidia bacterium]
MKVALRCNCHKAIRAEAIQLYDLQGRTLKVAPIGRNQSQTAISPEGLTPGMYLLRVDVEEKAVLKLVVD